MESVRCVGLDVHKKLAVSPTVGLPRFLRAVARPGRAECQEKTLHGGIDSDRGT